jgi:hypothetical protein
LLAEIKIHPDSELLSPDSDMDRGADFVVFFDGSLVLVYLSLI